MKTQEPTWTPYHTYVWTLKQMQAWVDYNGARALWDGKMWEMKYKKVCPGRYSISFQVSK